MAVMARLVTVDAHVLAAARVNVIPKLQMDL